MDYNKLEEENNILKKEIKRVEKEKDEALSRLSKKAGQKLMKGNPAIADLGNPNRPAKLAERWASLYTDEWSDVYEEITEKNNYDLVPEKQLMDIVVWCYEKCKEFEEAHRKTLEEKLLNAAKYVHVLENESDIAGSDEESSNHENADISQTIDALVENAISQRQCSSSLIKSVKKKCLKDYNERNHSPSSTESDFVQKCVELCWLMCIADPPMIIEFQNFEAKPIDMVKFNKYDTTGTTVEFVVWPVLLLHNDGPVLSKGIVQTYFSEQDQTNKNNPGVRQQPVTGKTKNTKYCVKFGHVCSGKAHMDTLHRNFGKLLEKSKLPRQFSVDKHQPY